MASNDKEREAEALQSVSYDIDALSKGLKSGDNRRQSMLADKARQSLRNRLSTVLEAKTQIQTFGPEGSNDDGDSVIAVDKPDYHKEFSEVIENQLDLARYDKEVEDLDKDLASKVNDMAVRGVDKKAGPQQRRVRRSSGRSGIG